jgi:hypothetical protein
MILIFILFMKKEVDLSLCLCSFVMGGRETIVEFLHIIEKLAHPECFGGKEEDALM